MSGTRSGKHGTSTLDALWAHHHGELRDPHQIASQWHWHKEVDSQLLRHHTRGPFWETLEATNACLVISREYEHLLLAICVKQGRPRISYFRLPHPSGVAVDPASRTMSVASTRNPNMVYTFAPCQDYAQAAVPRQDASVLGSLLPVACRYLPGSLYLHDLAMVGGKLCANAVGMNAVVELTGSQGYQPVWWPKAIEVASKGSRLSARGVRTRSSGARSSGTRKAANFDNSANPANGAKPRFDKNYLQVNSIAAGPSLAESFFSASTDVCGRRRPGHLNFPVDGKGVIFSGKTRDVIGRGLTRPHSARLWQDDIWVDNSGYGQLGRIVDGRWQSELQLTGWTRGLCFMGQLACVGTSRVIPKYRHYAPGLNVEESECGIHLVDMARCQVVASMLWPAGNQIFAIEALPTAWTAGFPFALKEQRGQGRRTIRLFSRGTTVARQRQVA